MKKTLFIMAVLVCVMQIQAQITDTGTNVGIGTTTPASKLHIQTSNATETFNTYLGGNVLHFDRSSNGTSYIDKTDAGDLILRFGLPVVNRFVFTNNGSLGVGTTAPKGKLHVNGSIYANMGEGLKVYGDVNYFGQYLDAIVFQMEDTNGTYGNTDGGFVFKGYTPTDGKSKEWMVIKTGGKVGIGTPSPTQKLHINDGNVLVTPENDNASGIFKINEYRGGALLDFSEVGDAGVLKVGYYGLTGDRVEINGGVSNTGAEIKGVDNTVAKFQLRSNGASYLNGGNVGIGTTAPNGVLEVKGTSAVWSDFAGYTGITNNSTTPNGKKATIVIGETPSGTYVSGTGGQVTYKGGLSFGAGGPGIYSINPNPAGSAHYGEIRFHTTAWNSSTSSYYNADRMVIKLNGDVGIGTTTPDAKLAVNGKIHTKEVKVDLVGWPDYVFEKEYDLPTLTEVETHIKEKGHLPNIPSAKEVAKEGGIELGKMNKKLLEKIEELTLYTIEQEKKIESSEKTNKKLLLLVEKLEERVTKLENSK